MEVVPYKEGFEVLFNGAAVPCYNDTDCPGAGICALNQTWSGRPGGWCMCNTLGGLAGAKCNEICSQGTAILVMNVLNALLCLSIVTVCVYFVHEICKRQAKRITNPVIVALILAGLGSLVSCVYSLVACVSTIGFRDFARVVVVGGRAIRRMPQSFDSAVFILNGLGGCLGICSVVVLPLAWIELANRGLRLRKTAVITVNLWVLAFTLVLLCVQLPLYVLSAHNFRVQALKWVEILAIVWYIVLGSTAFANIIAFAAMTRLQRRRLAGPASNSKSKVDLIIDRIQKTSFALVILIIINIVILWYLVQGFGRTIVSNPQCYVDPPNFAIRLSVMFRTLLLVPCLWFIEPIALLRFQEDRWHATYSGKKV